MKFLSRLVYSRSVVRVNHEDKALCSREVVSPQRTNLVLPAHVPNVKLDVLVRYRLDVEADSRNRGHVLVEFQFVQNR